MVGTKRKSVILFFVLLLFAVVLGPVPAEGASSDHLPEIEARSYVLVEIKTGRILAGSRENRTYPPASLTKIMTEYLVLKAVKQNRIRWDDKVKVSSRAAGIGEAQVYLRAGEEQTVKELFTAVAVYSANDAAVALAEYIAGSETAFVEKMNREAKRLGLKKSHFTNCTGLPKHRYPDPPEIEGGHHMSAMDIANLTRQLLKDYPQVTEITALPTFQFRVGEKRERKLVNRNKMLFDLPYHYEGVNGVKTGFTTRAGYNFVGSADKKGMQVVTVVMGTDSDRRRFTETKKLLDYAYEQYRMAPILSKGKIIPGHDRVSVRGGAETQVPIVLEETRVLPVRSGDDNYSVRVNLKNHLGAPVEAGTVVGKAHILHEGRKIQDVPPVRMVAKESVEEAGWITLIFRFVSGWFR
ncbi:D-Ala-D-Ala carboxypeptidase A [Melghirimyces profundicolus]|uniref:serine-type D-Ala-D-Ala carboxypeptidase n=1 Tax=Melghirimyces profundicolus TaxID=1242148 RepID=A0A2T6BAM2_9BACL|nr:D-alanyl-D-alanine carboxypeptidase family protein [Melghirimyces profundicolus]PTX53076.1 D-Ala-D-Ala carboxypeptidase A [Melghirimyces profundicolus]